MSYRFHDKVYSINLIKVYFYLKYLKGTNIVEKYYKCNLEINHMYTMVNDRRRELNQLSESENFSMNIKPVMNSRIEEINFELCEIGKRILESNFTAEEYDGFHELNQEK